MSSFKSLYLLAILYLATSLTVKDFKPAFFHSSQPSAFFNVDTGSPANGEILCFADINGDKYTDYIATDNRNGTALIVYYWSDVQTQFTNGSFTVSNPKKDYLAEVILTDLNADSTLQLLATFSSSNGVYYSQIYTITCQSGCNINRWEIDYSLLAQMTALPFPLDRLSNGTVHIFAFRNNSRYLVTCVVADKKLYSENWSSFLSDSNSSFAVVNSHFAAQVDINGDCYADLVVVSGQKNSNLQVYLKNHINNYQLTTFDLKKQIIWLTAGDLDANGAIDLFIVMNQSGTYNPYVLPNVNSPVDICQVYSKPPFNPNKIIAAKLPSTHKITKESNIKIGDFNFDGYPDLLGIFSLDSFRKVSILANVKQFNFNNFQVNLSQLQQINNPIQTSLYDFTQNGKLDIIITSLVTKDDGSQAYVRTSIINNIIDDTLFIKVLPLLPSSSSDLSSTALVGGFAITIQWRLTNLDGDKAINVMNQKSQWNYGSLQLPFATTGLGRTNNYIQDLTVGYPGYGVSFAWTPIIPNSQLIVLQQGGDWQLQTLLKDNSRVYSMIYVSVLCLLAMGVLIFFLNWRQRQQDKRDHYNFIHMIR